MGAAGRVDRGGARPWRAVLAVLIACTLRTLRPAAPPTLFALAKHGEDPTIPPPPPWGYGGVRTNINDWKRRNMRPPRPPLSPPQPPAPGTGGAPPPMFPTGPGLWNMLHSQRVYEMTDYNRAAPAVDRGYALGWSPPPPITDDEIRDELQYRGFELRQQELVHQIFGQSYEKTYSRGADVGTWERLPITSIVTFGIVVSKTTRLHHAQHDTKILIEGKMTIALFGDVVPKAARNFEALASGEYGYGYRGTQFHKVVAGRYIQGGDVEHKDGLGGRGMFASTSGAGLAAENFLLRHTMEGLVSLVPKDKSGGFQSQFLITLQPQPMLDNANIVIGRVIKGMDILEKIGTLEVDELLMPVGAAKAERGPRAVNNYHAKGNPGNLTWMNEAVIRHSSVHKCKKTPHDKPQWDGSYGCNHGDFINMTMRPRVPPRPPRVQAPEAPPMPLAKVWRPKYTVVKPKKHEKNDHKTGHNVTYKEKYFKFKKTKHGDLKPVHVAAHAGKGAPRGEQPPFPQWPAPMAPPAIPIPPPMEWFQYPAGAMRDAAYEAMINSKKEVRKAERVERKARWHEEKNIPKHEKYAAQNAKEHAKKRGEFLGKHHAKANGGQALSITVGRRLLRGT